jgi:hypothetical protein
LGELVAEDDKAMVLVMHGSQCDGCDIMAIPKDWTQKVEILERAGTALDNWEEMKDKICILENSEHQQESEDVEAKKKSKSK